MELQDTLFIWFNVSIVAMFIMGCFLYKYYPSFQYKDKLIITYLQLLFGIAFMIYLLIFNKVYPIFIVFIPTSLIYGVYKIVKLHKTKGEQLSPTLTDKKLLAWLQIFTAILGIIFIAVNKHHLSRTIFAIFVLYLLFSVKKLFDLRKQTLSNR